MVDLTENLDDPDFCRGVVLSLRAFLSIAPGANLHMEDIAYGRDAGTQAFIEIGRMDE